MRTLLAAVVMLAATSSTAIAQNNTSVTHLVQDGASAWAYESGPEGSYNFNAWATTRRGPDGMSEAYVYFNVGRRLGPDVWEAIWGSGYVPGSALKATGSGVRVQVADLMTVPDIFLRAERCEMFFCYEVPLPDAFPVDVMLTPSGRHSEERQGVMRRHTEFDWQANASVDVVEVGSSLTVTAIATGVLGPQQLRSPTSYMADSWIGQSRGSTITIERRSAQ